MANRDISAALNPEGKSMLEAVTKFSMEVMRPAGIRLDRLADPADVIAPDSELWDVYKKFRELGLHAVTLPKHLGGMAEEMDSLAAVLIKEQLGYADAGLAISLAVTARTFQLASYIPNPKIQQIARDYCEDKEGKIIGCWAVTEPDHGTDCILRVDSPLSMPSVRAVLKGDEYIVNGEKAAWISNGTIATHATLLVNLDSSRGTAGLGMAVIPLDLPGITRGKPLDKLGQRSLNQGSILFEDARIPKDYMVVPQPGFDFAASGIGLATVNGGMAITFAGVGRAAFDEACRYARERVQGGVPIAEHTVIKQKLMKMFMMSEAARANAHRMALYNMKNPLSPSVAHAVAAKCLSTETATHVASEAIQIFGGYGLAKEFVIEKIFRDARASMIEDGVNESLMIVAAGFL